MKLTDLQMGQSAAVSSVEGERLQRMKLLDMGLTPGTSITVRRVAPMGDPIEISLRGYVLTLRKDEAQLVSLDPMLDRTDAQESADAQEEAEQ